MASPPFLVAIGSNARTASPSVSFSSNIQKDDLELIIVVSANQTPSAPAGYTEITGVAGGTGTAGGAGAVRLAAFYKVLDGTETGVTVGDTGDHTYLIAARYRGVDISSPINASAGSVVSSASTSVSCPSITTTVDNCLVLNIVASDLDATGARLSGWANAALSSIIEKFDDGTTQGNGSGLGYIEGTKSSAGATGTTTATLASASVQALGTIALKPATAKKIYTDISSYSVDAPYIKLGSPDQDFKSYYIGQPKPAGIVSSVNLPEGLDFKADGTKMYTVEITASRVIRQYSLSTPWDITTASSDGVSFTISNLRSIKFSSDGMNLVVCTNSAIAFYSLSVAWDISTLSLINSTTISGQTSLEAVCMKSDGSIVLAVGRGPKAIYKLTCPTPFSTSGSSLTTLGTNVQFGGIDVKPNGNILFLTDVTNNIFYQFRLATAWDINAATLEYSYTTLDYTDDPYEFRFSGDGSRFYTLDKSASSNNIFQYNVVLGQTMSVDTASYNLNGNSAGLTYSRRIVANRGIFTETGISNILRRALKLPITKAIYSLTGITTGLNKGKTITAAPASFVASGNSVILKRTAKVSAALATFGLTGNTIALGKLFKASLAPLSYSFSGAAALFSRTRRLKAGTGSFSLTGFSTGNTDIKVPSTTFTPTYYAPTFAGEGIVNKVLVPLSSFTMTEFLPSVAAGVSVAIPSSTFSMEHGVNFAIIEMVESCSGENIPLSHMQDSKKLEADAYIDLFQIVLKQDNGILYLKMNKTMEWQGNSYQGTLIKLTGVGSYADDQVSRPSLAIWNPEGVFSALVDKGILNNARVYRIRVLKDDLINNRPVYRRSQWKVSRVSALVAPFINLELRDMLDGQNFLTPARMFMPPEFPTVSLQ